MSAEAAFTRTWRVGAYRATLSCPRPRPGVTAAALVSWHPHVPQRLTPAERDEYRAGRDSALADLARELRVSVGVIDL
jgi:hypothetical protein